MKGPFYVTRIVAGPDVLTPEQRERMWYVLGVVRQSRMNLDPKPLIELLEVDSVYESQNIVNPLVGRDAIAEYLRGRFQFFRQQREIKDLGQFIPGEVDLPQSENYPCLIVEGGGRRQALWVLELSENGLIRRFDILTVAPHPSEARPLRPEDPAGTHFRN